MFRAVFVKLLRTATLLCMAAAPVPAAGPAAVQAVALSGMQAAVLRAMHAAVAPVRPAAVPPATLAGVPPASQAPLPAAATPLAPIERSGFSALTPYDTLQSFLREIAGGPGFTVDTIAVSREGRAVQAVTVSRGRFGADPRKLRVMIFAQQHGDEPSGKEAVTLLLARLARGEEEGLLDSLDLLLVPQVNPDGAEAGSRRTSDGIDLNRSHVLLQKPETAALHRLFDRWLPHVTVDVHEYSSFSSSWLDSSFIKTGDVQLGLLTNLNSSRALRVFQKHRVLPAVVHTMLDAGYSCHEYVVGSPGAIIRHSTTEINDGRQSFGVEGTMSFIQEGRKWRTLTDSLARRTLAQFTAIRALLSFVQENTTLTGQMVSEARKELLDAPGKLFVTRMEHDSTGTRLAIPVLDVRTDKPLEWDIPRYHGAVAPLSTTRLPAAYAVPANQLKILELLCRHGIQTDTLSAPREAIVEFLTPELAGGDTIEEEYHPWHVVGVLRDTVELEPGTVLVPLRQRRSFLAASILEPGSMWGLVRYEEFSPLFVPGPFPVGRILELHPPEHSPR